MGRSKKYELKDKVGTLATCEYKDKTWSYRRLVYGGYSGKRSESKMTFAEDEAGKR